MKKLKILFVFNELLYTVDSDNQFKYNNPENGLLQKGNDPVKLNPNSEVVVYKSSLLIEFDQNTVHIYDIRNNFTEIFSDDFREVISLYDTSIKDDFLCICLENNSYAVISLISFERTDFLSQDILLNTNGNNIIEWSVQSKKIIVTQSETDKKEISASDFYTDALTENKRNVSIEKAIKKYNEKNIYLLQSDYNFIYKIDFENLEILPKIEIKATFLGDTTSLSDGDFHITNQYIFKLDWNLMIARKLLNWSEVTQCDKFPGIIILHTIQQDVIIFLGTTVGLVVFYSTKKNEVLFYVYLNKVFYTNTKSILFKDKLYLIDSEGSLHHIDIPKELKITNTTDHVS